MIWASHAISMAASKLLPQMTHPQSCLGSKFRRQSLQAKLSCSRFTTPCRTAHWSKIQMSLRRWQEFAAATTLLQLACMGVAMDWLKWPHLPGMELRQAYRHYSALLVSKTPAIAKTRASFFREWWNQRSVQLLDKELFSTKNN